VVGVVCSLLVQANKFAELARQAAGTIEAAPNAEENGAKKSVKIK
jgi:hypothetical protein